MRHVVFLLALAIICRSFYTEIREEVCFQFAEHPGQSYNLEYFATLTHSGSKLENPVNFHIKNSNQNLLLSGSDGAGTHSVSAETAITICFSPMKDEAVYLDFDVYLDHHKQIKSIAHIKELGDLDATILYTKEELAEVARKEQFRADQQSQYASVIMRSEDKIKFWSAVRILLLFVVVGIQAMVFRGLASGGNKFQI